MKVLIAGGSGFIGSHLTVGLARDGHEVVVLTRGQPGAFPPPRAGEGPGSGSSRKRWRTCSEDTKTSAILVLTNTRICVRIGSVAARRPSRGVLHAPILEARPHRWRGHRAGRLYRPWRPPGDPAPSDRLPSAAIGAAELAAARHPDAGDAAPAAG